MIVLASCTPLDFLCVASTSGRDSAAARYGFESKDVAHRKPRRSEPAVFRRKSAFIREAQFIQPQSADSAIE
jgi:hypothetical protein